MKMSEQFIQFLNPLPHFQVYLPYLSAVVRTTNMKSTGADSAWKAKSLRAVILNFPAYVIKIQYPEVLQTRLFVLQYFHHNTKLVCDRYTE